MGIHPGRLNVIIDGQWGSTGKGKLAGYLAKRFPVNFACADFQPNAGHTWVGDDGESIIVNFLPLALVNTDVRLFIGPGSTLAIDKLLEEIERLSKYHVAERLMIHPHAGVVIPDDYATEQSKTKRIGSTIKGSGSALARKIMRTANLAQDFAALKPFLGDTATAMQKLLAMGATGLAESAQGFDLSLNHGFAYPYVTSRDCSPCALLSNQGIPHTWLGNVWGSLRTYPIRVGHVIEEGVKVGDSGPFYPDQTEVDWEYVNRRSGSINSTNPLEPERTTVTKRVRRVFTFSNKQLLRFVRYCAPTHLFMNFVNYLDHEAQVARVSDDLPNRVTDWVRALQYDINMFDFTPCKPKIELLGTGPKDSEMVEWKEGF